MFTWDARKRIDNFRKHGLDFAQAYGIFDAYTLTEEDTREPYGERRFFTLGILHGVIVAVTHTERGDGIRIISLRKASRYETEKYFESLAD
jgi:hypothetical protein